MTEEENKRRSLRIPFEALITEMNIGGRSVQVRISDLSQDGVRLVLEEAIDINPDQEVELGVGAISPNMKGRVRWMSGGGDGPMELGVEFESFLIVRPDEKEVQGLLDAWQDISHSYDLYESFLQILVLVDFEVADGKIVNLSDALYSMAVWIEQRMGPINLWGVMHEPDGSISISPLVILNPYPPEDEALRMDRVLQVARGELTELFDGKPYLFGGDVVIEFLGEGEGKSDLLQRLVVLLSRRLQFWSKIMMKNISLQLLGDELERLRDGKAKGENSPG